MSTDHQKYSTENQAAAIREYALRHNMAVVRSYADDGKSGLNIDARAALKALIKDVESRRGDFEAILVYDVSRWGRFQDVDESAHYEYLCKRAGVKIIYCAEQFTNDGTPVSSIIKSVKRAMAGEYSRELSTKVFAGQCRLVQLGYHQGGAAGYGIRRQLLEDGKVPGDELQRGQHKSIQTDRVALVPGPEAEIAVVQRIYRDFVHRRLTEREIAGALNTDGITTDLGRPWTRGTVHQILVNEKYIGNNVYNRTSFKLKKERVKNDPRTWVRRDGAFPAIVSSELFEAARLVIVQRSQRMSYANGWQFWTSMFRGKPRLSTSVYRALAVLHKQLIDLADQRNGQVAERIEVPKRELPPVTLPCLNQSSETGQLLSPEQLFNFAAIEGENIPVKALLQRLQQLNERFSIR